MNHKNANEKTRYMHFLLHNIEAQLTDCTADLTAGLVCIWEEKKKKKEKCQRCHVKWATVSNLVN